jgi:hypothetical protein
MKVGHPQVHKQFSKHTVVKYTNSFIICKPGSIFKIQQSTACQLEALQHPITATKLLTYIT